MPTSTGIGPSHVVRQPGLRTAEAQRAPDGFGVDLSAIPATRTNDGAPLDATIRTEMEARFGHDFGAVRIHAGAAADMSARALRARAYTVGNDVVFREGAYRPGTAAGDHLLAHELAHVVQQNWSGAGGALTPAQAESDARQAAAGWLDDAQINVRGRSPVRVACEDEDEDDAEGEAKAAERARDKAATQRRARERAAAGKDPALLTQAEAENEARALERSYRQPGAKQRSPARKAADLERYRRLIARTAGTTLEKSQRRGAFDELQRTPSATAGPPQTKHVAGGPALPDHDLPPGQSSYAQPDYSLDRRRPDGSLERIHVNLKSDDLVSLQPSAARARARAYVDQAVRNSRHLANGESIVISFAQVPSKEVQDEMNSVLFRPGSPISEVRYGTTTHRRPITGAGVVTPGTSTPPAATPAPKKSSATKKKAVVKPPVVSGSAPPAVKTPTATKPQPTVKPPVVANPPTPSTVPTAKVPPAPSTVPTAKVPPATTPAPATPKPAQQPVTATPPAQTSPGTTLPTQAPTTAKPAPSRPLTVRVRVGSTLRSLGSSYALSGAGLAVDLLAAYFRARLDAKEIQKGVQALWPKISADVNRRAAEIAALQAAGKPAFANVKVSIIRARLFMPGGMGASESAAGVEGVEVSVSSADINTGEHGISNEDWYDIFSSRSEMTWSFPVTADTDAPGP